VVGAGESPTGARSQCSENPDRTKILAYATAPVVPVTPRDFAGRPSVAPAVRVRIRGTITIGFVRFYRIIARNPVFRTTPIKTAASRSGERDRFRGCHTVRRLPTAAGQESAAGHECVENNRRRDRARANLTGDGYCCVDGRETCNNPGRTPTSYYC
jgi:hypothetical protein